jgi:hypothetical protein
LASKALARRASRLSAPAIANAVEDAIGMPGAITELPITPQRLKIILDRRASLHPNNQAVLQKPRRERGLP